MKRNRLILAIFAVFFCAASFTAPAAVPPKGELKTVRTPEECDSLLSCWYEGTVVESYDRFVHDFIDIDLTEDLRLIDVDKIPDSVYQARLRMIASVIQLPYNEIVRRYIIAYTGRLKRHMQNILGLAQLYFPYIEEELDRQGVPAELKILPIIESALYPKAVSRAGATGLWQFMLRTGKGMGLEINSFVDERMDPIASTQAACRYLKQLYAIYGDWTLVIAAYNCGPGNVNKAMKRAENAKTYWDIYDYLPQETRGYVPSFIAATYAYTFHKVHGMEPNVPQLPLSTDTITINKMMHMEQISSTLGVSLDLLRELNPQFKLDIVPATDKSYKVILPQQAITAFIDKEGEIYGKDTVYLQQYLNPANLTAKVGSTMNPATRNSAGSGKTYKVQKNDVLGSIARRHGVSVNALMRANNIRDARKLRVGQVLKIP